MKKDIQNLGSAGADGFVFGILTEDGDVDKPGCQCLMDEVSQFNKPATFHRAIDMCRDPMSAVEDIISLNFTYILTSGQQKTALQGAELIRKMIEKFKHSITIMPGSGVNSDNVRELIERTGATMFHGSGSCLVKSSMKYRVNNCQMGSDDSDEYSIKITNGDVIKEIIHNSAIMSISTARSL